MRRIASVVLAVLALVGAGLARARLAADADAALAKELSLRADQASASAATAFEAERTTLQLKASAAAGLPIWAPALQADQRIAQLGAIPGSDLHEDEQAGQRTLRDLLEDEAPFDPIRRELVGYGIVTDKFDEVLVALERSWLPREELITHARTQGPATAVVRTPARTLLVGAAPISVLPVPGVPVATPVMVIARALDRAVLTRLGGDAHAALFVSDGQRVVVEGPASPDALSLVGQEKAKDPRSAAGDVVGRAASIAPGLWLWAAADVGPLIAEHRAALAATQREVWVGAGILLLLATVLGLWPRRPAPIPLFELDRTQASIRTTGPGSSPAPAPKSPITGDYVTSFGRYLVVGKLGSGGMGEVFLAVAHGAEGFRRSFVIKRLRAELSHEPQVVAQFIDEARLASSLVHANIIPTFDFGKVGEQYFMAQEYVDGRDLERLAGASEQLLGHALPPRLVIHVAHQVLQALAFAHSRLDDAGRPLALVHRDVSPQNVMISARGEVKLFDFGIMKSTAGLGTTRPQTDIGVVKGNVVYMAPEQARGLAVDHRADLFSLGLVLYRCLAGQLLYRDTDAFNLLTHAAHGLGEADLSNIDALPAPFPAVLRQALAYAPDARFASAAEMDAALPPTGAAEAHELGALVARLFGAELDAERAKLTAAPAAEAAAQESVS